MRFYLVLLFFLTFSISFSQNFNSDKLNDYLTDIEKKNVFYGSLAVRSNDSIVYKRSIGYTDIDMGLLANDFSKYRIGSISKTFTAVLVFKALEENNIKLTETIESYFPKIKNAKNITIDNLLYHRSGIYDFTNDPEFEKWKILPKTEDEILSLIIEGGSLFEPDTRAEYSNSNFYILSLILQKKYDSTYAELIDKYIIKPLGLKNTKFGGRIDSENNESHSYVYGSHWEKSPETHMSIPLGAGSIITTPSDLCVFANALFNGKIIDFTSLSIMKNFKDNFGAGIFPMELKGKYILGHTGGIDGSSAFLGYLPEIGYSLAITSNASRMNNFDIANNVISSIFNISLKNESITSFNLSKNDLSVYEGIYASDQVPLEVSFFVKEDKLWSKATGQNEFPLDFIGDDVFQFEQANIKITFDKTNKQMSLNQGGLKYVFKKKN
ncbi:serine hydrolase [Aquimarina sp. AU119]|uniref:serine hydrolase domain-containing protein n=1 Tax=Aquimarina sp. AU119 TaxID=2108528 RepID=UPI000D68AE7B|nr:serine hydrolase domain-containing protein [Aquimarina sp. AU119]